MIFPDGNRIDLHITANPYIDDGEPAVVLLDKEKYLPEIEVQKDHWYVKKPEQKIFSDCCNEFHWCLNNVAKEIARDELSYAMEQLGFTYDESEEKGIEHYMQQVKNGKLNYDDGAGIVS